ncbi:MAG: FecR family protein [Odoribacteraceae bacterium]|jgi:ferric-dicitrate binding protein FerR (iron transport regulator)|nr:FecR family protein [Odoribacteraceae bacterium]
MDKIEARYEIARLIAAEVLGTLGEEDARRLKEWLEASAGNRREYERIVRRLKGDLMPGEGADEGADVVAGWERFRVSRARRRVVRLWRRVAVAAVLSGLVLTLGYRHGREAGEVSPVAVAEIVKRHKAVLILGNGERVMISDSSRGLISASGEARVVSIDNRLRYEGMPAGEDSSYHTVEVPRGGEYELLLSDGTRVWLNSGSRVRFPVRFTGDTREVEMDGEVCFDVAKDGGRPFVVRAGEVSLRVLGTLFNVEAYAGEPVVTTLVNGSLKLSSGKNEQMLRPGEQATLLSDGFVVREMRASESVEWIHGVFNFTDTSLEMIMKRLARWYDVDVFYRDRSAGDARFTLEIKRYDNIASVLSKIEMTERVHFSVDGNRVFVEE